METHPEQITSRQAVKLIGTLSRQSKLNSVSVSDVAKLLHIPEAEILEEAKKNRRVNRRHFVDHSGLVSAAISLALVVGFVAALFWTDSGQNPPSFIPMRLRFVGSPAMTTSEAQTVMATTPVHTEQTEVASTATTVGGASNPHQ